MKKSRLLLLLVGLFFSFISLSAQAVWDGTVATSFAGGTGTEDDPYLISNGAELAYLAQIAVNSLATEGKFYRLTEDIILNEDVLNEDYSLNGTPANPFKPISYFYGTFDGNGHVISGLYINDSSGTAVGLFGSFYGLVYDLAVVDAYIYGTWSTGIIVGNGYGGAGISMTRCYAAGNVTGYYAGLLLGGDNGSSTIEYCYCAGVVSSSHCAGGIAGDVYNNVNHCFAVAKLTSGSGLIDFTHGSTFAHLYYDKDICNLNSVINETCYGKSTEEMQSEEFAELLGAPFVYVNGNYPYIEGLPMVGELTSNTSGYRLNVGTLTNGKGSKVKYYREYDGTDVSKATSRSEAGETVYVKVTPRIRMLLTGGAPVVTNNTTEGAVTLTALANGIWSFTMPESDVSVTASFYRDPDAPDVWDGTVATTFAGGLGTESNPYKISNGAELAYLAKIVNENIESTEGKYYMLVNDIVLNEEVLTRDFYLNGTPENAWIPIGSGSGYYFKGTLDGDYHVISGLYIENMYGDYSGFIGNLYGGAVKNLSLVDAYGSGSEVGLLVARIDNNSLVSQCYVEGFADGGSYSSTLISVSDYNISGSSSVIEYCYTSGRTNTSSMRPACFISYQQNNTIMRNCYSVAISTTAINGLVAGDNMLNVYVCSNNCTPFSYNDTFCSKSREEMMSEEFAQLLGEPFEIGGDNYPYIPGLAKVGEKQSSPITGYRLYVGELTNSKGCTVKYYRNYDGTDVSKATSRAEAGETVYLKVIPRKRMLLTGGAPVVTDAADGSVKLTALSDSIWSFTMPESAVTVTASFYKDPNAPNVWDGSVADSFAGGTGTQDDPYLISDGAELAYLSKIANDNPNSTAGQYYQLVSDIVLNEDVLDENFNLKNGIPANLWTPIVDTEYYNQQKFQGDFNGNGHIISGLYAERTSYPQYVGLFGCLGGNAKIHDLAVIDSYILCQYTGGLITGGIGDNATISRCYVEGRLTGNCQYSGLLAGGAGGTPTIEYCYTSGYHDGAEAHSGLLGASNGATVRNCFTAARVLNNGYSRTGALVGWIQSGTDYKNLYYDNTKEQGVKAAYGSDKETCYGLTTEEMQSESFATLLGEPFVFAEGNYPYIEGLPRVGETEAFNPAGSRISVGTLTNGGGSSIRFYREYQDGTLKRRTSYAEAGETIYMQLNIRKRMLLTEGSLKLLNDETGQTVALTSVGENIWSFTMPENAITATAAFYRDPTVPPLWDGSVADAFAEGDGTEEDPYIIHDGEELAYLAQLTNANADLTKNKYFELGADIYLNDIMLNDELELEGTPDNEWTPIGNSSNAFRGHFDGKDHIISGLYTNGGDYRGLFGVVEGATIQNLNIIDSYVKGNVIGALAGSMGRNDSCFVSRCYIEATLDPTGSSAGLITGLTCYLNMKNCYTNGQVKNSYSYRGSLVGQIYNSPTITNCFTVVKGAQPLGNMNANGNTNNVYFDSDFFGSTYTNRDNFRSATNIEMFTTDFAERMGEPYEYVLGNYPYIPGLMKVGENRGWESPTDPTHGGAGDVWDGERSIIFASGTGTETDPYIINNGAQLAYLAKLTNANANLTKNRYFELGADIVLNENVLDNDFELKDTPANVWEPIGYSTSNVFRGHFDGKGHNISGLYINGGDYRGLFGVVDASTICNLNIIDSYVAGSTIGALAGSLGGNDSCFVSRCYVEATLYPTSSNSGLIAGMTCYLNMEDCYTSGQVKNSYSYRGGLLGYMVNSPTVTNCFAAVKNVQAAGNVNNGGNFYNVYYDSDMAGSTHKTSEYFRGVTNIEMMTKGFADSLRTSYVYMLGNYPYIPGLMYIGQNRNWTTPTDPTHGGAGGTWDGERSILFASGTGTEEDPYLINNGAQLAYLAALTNANGTLTKERYFELGADIYLNDIMLNDELELEGTPDNEWTPIGNSSNAFRGHFDGKDHIISGLYTNGGDYRGLFGVVEGATIQNLNIIDSYVKGNVIGALAGSMGRNDSCFVSRCYIEATLDPTGSSAGLITGLTCYLNMKNCYTNGQVKNSYSYRGSLVGQIYNSPTITNCFTVVKGAQPLGNMNANGNTNNVYFDSDFFGSTYTNRDNFRSATNIEMFTTDFAKRMGEPYEYVLGNYPYIPGLMKVGENRGWESPTDPTHGGAGDVWDGERSIIFASGTGTETDPYIINNGAQLAYLAKLTNANANLTKNRYFELGADIVLNENVLDNDFELKDTPANVWEPIGYSTSNVFRGHFDGKGHNISGIYTNGGDYRGLFGIVEGSTICNLNIIDSYVAGSTIGALAGSLGRNDSCFVSRCYVEATLYPTSSNSGLIAGMTCYLNMEECYVNGQVKNSYSYRGGLLGYMVNSPTVTNCYAVVKNVQAAGNVNNGGNFYNVYYDSDIAGSTHKTSEYFRGATTVEMLSTDFATRMGEPYEYALGYYPFIYGMHKINKDGKTVIVKGYSLQLGTLTNGKNCNISFYRTYVKKTNTLDNQVIAGSKVMLEGPTAIYAKLDIDATKRLSDDGLIVKTITGESIEVSKVDDDLYMFTMPENTITVSAKFVTGGFCGNPEVNNGRDMMWQLSDDQNTLTISGTGEMYSNAWTTYASNVTAIEVNEGVTGVKAQAFKGMNKVTTATLPETLETIGSEAFSGCTATVDLRPCTLLTTLHANEFAQFAGTTLWLPATVTSIEANTFTGSTVEHVYSPIEDGQSLYANNNQVLDVNGYGDIRSYVTTADLVVTLTRGTGYVVHIGTTTGGGLKFFADEALTTEIPNGYKAIRNNDNTRVYIKVAPNAGTILLKSGLTVSCASGNIATTQEGDEVFSFIMPKEAITATAQFTKGGYSGKGDVNSGHNLIWTLVDGTLAFQKNPMAQGSNLDMGDFTSTGTPWNGSEVTTLDLGDATSIGNDAFAGCTALVGIELSGAPIAIGSNAFAKSTWIIVPVATYSVYQTEWAAYSDQIVKDKETLSMNEGQQWRTFYSKVGRKLPTGLLAYTVKSINGNKVITDTPIDYVPANEAVLIEHSDKTALTTEATTTIAPYSTVNQTPVCNMTTEQANLLQWLTAPKSVSVGDGYTLYKDEFVMVSSGTLPAGVAFLPEPSAKNAPRLTIYKGETTEIDIVNGEGLSVNGEADAWYTIDGKKMGGKPEKKGMYIHNGQKVVIK